MKWRKSHIFIVSHIQKQRTMDSKAEQEAEHHSSTNIKIPILPLILSAPPSPEPSSAAVPFRWEREPGKPKNSTAIVPFSEMSPKSLDLPPRLLTTPHNPSFRLSNSGRFGSFRDERGRLPVRSLVRRIGVKRRWFGSWRIRKKREVNGGGGSYVLSSSFGVDHRETCDVDGIGCSRKNRVKTKSSALWVLLFIFSCMHSFFLDRFHALYTCLFDDFGFDASLPNFSLIN